MLPEPRCVASDPLVALIEQSMQRGHRKVAAQRTLMLLHRYGDAPARYLDLLDEVLQASPAAQVRRMREAAMDWARMTRMR